MRRADVVRDGFLVVLAACGGAFDAVSYLRLHAFTANMTGNTVFLGLAVGGAHLTDALHNAAAIAAFAVGAFLGAVAGKKATKEDPWPAALIRAFALEIALIVAFAIGATALPQEAARIPVLLALGSLAMGIQTAITRDVHHGGASTTAMTSSIARTLEFLADALRLGFRGETALNAIAWLVYFCAAIGVGVLEARRGDVGPVPWIVAGVVLVVALAARPLVTRAR
jgi:uncharacterized membrane protein YoaK (UPF0700 family)